MEPWTDWIKRCTREAEHRMNNLRLDDWITLQRRRKWSWASKVATRESNEWAVLAAKWDPTLNSKLRATRRVGRPKTRWTDDIQTHIYQELSTPPTCTTTPISGTYTTSPRPGSWTHTHTDTHRTPRATITAPLVKARSDRSMDSTGTWVHHEKTRAQTHQQFNTHQQQLTLTRILQPQHTPE